MKHYRDAVEVICDNLDEAISDCNIPAARAWRADLEVAVNACHVEALAVNEILEFAGERMPVQQDGDMNCVFEEAVAIWVRTFAHTEALFMNEVVNSGERVDVLPAAQTEAALQHRAEWRARTAATRQAAFEYFDAFTEFDWHQKDAETLTHSAITWLYTMDQAHLDNASFDFNARCAAEAEAHKVYEVTGSHANGDITRHGKFSHAARESAYNLAASLEREFGKIGTEYYVDIH